MSEEKKRTKAVESTTSDSSLAEEALDQASGGVDGADYAVWRSNYGATPPAAGESQATDKLKDGDVSSSDPEWKYVPVRRTT